MAANEQSDAARRKNNYLSKLIDPRKKAERLEDQAKANHELHKRLRAEALERWSPDTVCMKPACLNKRHAKGYCQKHYDRERRRERIQPR